MSELVSGNGQENRDFKKLMAVRLNRLAVLFNQPVNEAKVQLYWEILSPQMTPEEFIEVCKKLESRFKQEYGVKFPMPAHFIDAAQKTDEDLFDDYYQNLQGINFEIWERVGCDLPWKGDEHFEEVLKVQGGLFNIKQWTVDDFKYNRSRLKESYLNLRIRAKRDQLALPWKEKSPFGGYIREEHQ